MRFFLLKGGGYKKCRILKNKTKIRKEVKNVKSSCSNR